MGPAFVAPDLERIPDTAASIPYHQVQLAAVHSKAYFAKYVNPAVEELLQPVRTALLVASSSQERDAAEVMRQLLKAS